MKNLFKTVLITVSCLSVVSLQAQEPLVLSLDSAVNYAINHNKTFLLYSA